MNRFLPGGFLVHPGHRMKPPSGEMGARGLMDKDPPAWVFSDIQTPGMDGIAFLKAVRERFSDLPVILVTGYATVETAVAALRGRAYDYLRKPVQLQELQACIARLEGGGFQTTARS